MAPLGKTTEYTVQSAGFSYQSSESGPPHPLAPLGSVAPPPLGPRGVTHSLAGKGVGGPNYDEGTDTLVLNVSYKSATGTSTTNM